jgi:hypothetical protein
LGLFNIFKNQKEEKELKKINFTTEIIKTDNVSKSLLEIGEKYDLALSNLDFDILNVETYIRLHKDDDFVLMDDETENLIIKEKLLLNEDFDIKQSYEIRVKKFQFSDDFELIGKFQTNKSLTRAIFIISPQSLLNYSNKLESIILNELYKKKLKAQMIIKFKPFEEKLLNDVKNLITKIRVVGMIEEDFSVILCEAITPIEPIKMEIIEHYKVLAKEDEFVKELIYPCLLYTSPSPRD